MLRGNSGDHGELSPGNETDRDVRDITPSRMSASRSSHSIDARSRLLNDITSGTPPFGLRNQSEAS